MDILSDTLNSAGLKAQMLHQRRLPKGAVHKFPCERSIGFHVVVQGVVFLHTGSKKQPVELRQGDIVLMARGCHHSLCSSATSSALIVSGAYQLWNEPVHPFFRELPNWYILRYSQVSLSDGLVQLIDLLARESQSDQLGSERIIQGLLDVMFSLIVRRVIQESAEKKPNWCRSTQDENIRKAFDLLHSNIARAWTLDDLAKAVGVSRSGFAGRFKKMTGTSPLKYLTTLRMQKAIRLLTSTELSIEQISREIGQSDMFTFSKSFKRMTGLSPREYRRKKTSNDSAFSVR